MHGPSSRDLRDDAPFPTGRFARALLLAHGAAAATMAAGMGLMGCVGGLFDPDTFAHGLPSPGRIAEVALCMPLVTGVFAVWIAILLIPYGVVGALVAWPLVAARCVGQRGAILVGGGCGLLLATARLWLDASSDGAAKWDMVTLWLVACGLAAGASFGWVIWRIAIRPDAGHPHHRAHRLRSAPYP